MTVDELLAALASTPGDATVLVRVNTDWGDTDIRRATDVVVVLLSDASRVVIEG